MADCRVKNEYSRNHLPKIKTTKGEKHKNYGEYIMKFMDKDLEDIVVSLPFEDGTSMDCGVYSYFEVNNKKYFALLPLKGEKELDFSHSYMLYEVEEDEEQNPIILYIEDDMEYAIASQYFSRLLDQK